MSILSQLSDMISQKPKVWYCDLPECTGDPHYGAWWCDHPIVSDEHTKHCRHARTDQKVPQGDDWTVWLYLAGRGTGKTRSASEYITWMVMTNQAKRIALVGRTPADVRDIMIEGESGLVNIGALRGFEPKWESSKRRLTWPNGAIATSYSAEVANQLRGPEHDLAWGDETAAWKDAIKGDVLDTSWNNLKLGLRLGQHPKAIVTTTPKNVKLIKEIKNHRRTAISTASTYTNLKNLSSNFKEDVIDSYEGTRIGRQELMGELLEDMEGALWKLAQIDSLRVSPSLPLQLVQIVVAVDPSGGDKATSDEVGIIVVGKDSDGHGYVLEDLSGRYSPSKWAQVAMQAYETWQANKIVAEVNYGGDMVENTLRSQHYYGMFEKVRASRGKQQRAEPVAALYGDPSNPDTWLTKGKVHHVGSFPKLEDEMTAWTPESNTSPNRLDAMVWGFTALNLKANSSTGYLQYLANNTKKEIGSTKNQPTCKHFWRLERCLYCNITFAEYEIENQENQIDDDAK